MSYVVEPFAASKRVRSIDAEGKEEYEEQNIWRQIKFNDNYMPNEETAEEAPNPSETLQVFNDAKGELEVILDVITNIENNQHLCVKYVTKQRGSQLLQDLTRDSIARLARKQAALKRAAQRLSAGSVALKRLSERDNAFYSELGCLQKFWKLKLSPPGTSANFAADLSLGTPAALELAKGVGGAAADTVPTWVPLTRNADGQLAAQLDLPAAGARQAAKSSFDTTGGPQVAVGMRQVHEMLNQRQAALMWHMVRRLLELESLRGGAANSFLLSLAQLVVDRSADTSDPRLRALRPLVLETLLSRALAITHTPGAPPGAASATARAWAAAAAAASGAGVPPPSSLARGERTSLLADLSALLQHMSMRDYVRHEMDRQVACMPGAALHWLSSWRPGSSAMELRLTAAHRVMLIVRGSKLEVEGLLMKDAGSRWALDTSFKPQMQDVPRLLAELRRTLCLDGSNGARHGAWGQDDTSSDDMDNWDDEGKIGDPPAA